MSALAQSFDVLAALASDRFAIGDQPGAVKMLRAMLGLQIIMDGKSDLTPGDVEAVAELQAVYSDALRSPGDLSALMHVVEILEAVRLFDPPSVPDDDRTLRTCLRLAWNDARNARALGLKARDLREWIVAENEHPEPAEEFELGGIVATLDDNGDVVRVREFQASPGYVPDDDDWPPNAA